MQNDTLRQHNAELEAISREMFGDAMRLMVVEPGSLMLLKDNARFFKRETFRQLRDNIAADKRLSSVPLCYRHEDGRLEVLSGNHRVQASIEAGLTHIMVLVITETLDKSRRIAIQLSHNSLVGQDDQSILANLWAQVESVQDKLYSGLDSEMLQELVDVDLVNFATPQVPAHMVTFMFTDGERERLSEILDLLADVARRSSSVHIFPGAQYEAFTKLLQDVKNAEKIRDSSLAMTRILEIIATHLESAAEAQPEDIMNGEAK